MTLRHHAPRDERDPEPTPRRRDTLIYAALNDKYTQALKRRQDHRTYRNKELFKAAAGAALAGVPMPSEHLPAKESAKKGGAPVSAIAWSHHPDEFEECRSAIVDVGGGTIRAAMTAAIQAYVDDPRDALPLDWTPFPLPKRGRRNH